MKIIKNLKKFGVDDMKLSKYNFYLLSIIWGLPITILGLVLSLVFILFKYKPIKNKFGWYFQLGPKNAGFSLGPMAIIGTPSEYLTAHEFGHAIQNCIYGPFMILIILASVVRFWYREWLVANTKINRDDLPPYDNIWFESQATNFGNRYK